MPRLALSLLGGFQARLEPDKPLDIVAKKTRGLLAYLALPPGRAHSRDKLMNLFWSDRGVDQARSSLRQALSQLGQAFGQEGATLLLKGRDTLALDSDATEVDAVLFEQIAGSEDRCDLRRAAALYRGELLEGFGIRDQVFETWLAGERRRYRELAISVFRRLAREEKGADALAAGQRLLALDPLQEEGHRLLMQLYFESGEIGPALRQYEICRDTLKQELNVTPSEETERLLRAIRDRSVQLNEGPAPTTTPASLLFGDRKEPALATRPTIAVLPFANLGGDPEQEFFSDGITDDITTELSRFHSLFVISRNSAFTYKGRATNVIDIGRDLGVGFVVQGSVRRLGSRVRITAQLVNTASGNHVWAERYDRPFEALFDVQDEVVSAIVATAEGRLASEIAERSRSIPRANITAYELVLQARHLLGTYTTETVEPLLRRALALDPDYAQAHAWLSMVYLYDFFNDFDARTIAEAVALGQKAVALDPNDSQCHGQLGYNYLFARKYELADLQTRRAMEINPSDSVAVNSRSQWLARTGQAEEAIRVLNEALRRDPYPPSWYWENLSVAYITRERFKEAIAAINRKSRHFWWDHYMLGSCYSQLGMTSQAQAEMAELHRLRPKVTIKELMIAEPYQNNEDSQRLVDGLRKAGLPD
jgi:TolB-like protein